MRDQPSTRGGAARPSRLAAIACALALCLAAAPAPGAEGEVYGLPLLGQEAEEFLRTAEVIDREDIPEGVTRPQRLTLTDGERTLRAAWKTIDERRPGIWRDETGGYQFDFRDSWKHEVAFYELDKMLGLGLVPPTVERRIDGRRGALQLWVEGVITEDDRQERGLKPEGPRQIIRWHNQMHCIRLIRQLIYDTDYRNIENVLVDPDFRAYVIDASRAFRIQQELLSPDDLQCFSRQMLERLRKLDRDQVETALGRWLDDRQVDGLLERRDRILTLVKVRLVESGPGKVLFQ